MGAKRQHGNATDANAKDQISVKKLPQGVTVRHYKNSDSIQIYFRYRGVDCRETIKLPPNANNIRYADNLRRIVLHEIAIGKFNYCDHFPNSKRARLFGHAVSNVTVGDLLNKYLKRIEKTLQPSMVRGYKEICKVHLLPQFGNVRASDLKPFMIREWIEGLSLTSKRVRNILIPLRAVLNLAVTDEQIEANPLHKVDVKEFLALATRNSNYTIDPFTKEEINAILDCADGQMKNFVQFAFFTGLRPGELIALEWGDIDWINGLIHVTRSVVEGKKKAPKTKSGVRDVKILPYTLAALKDQKQHTYFMQGRVFHNPTTQQPWECDQQIQKAWKRLLTKAGVRYRRPYQTRHSFASMMLSRGENLLWVSKQLGHKKIETTIKYYATWMPDHSKQAGYETVGDWGSFLDSNAQNKQKSG